jgi:hypothetical protein
MTEINDEISHNYKSTNKEERDNVEDRNLEFKKEIKVRKRKKYNKKEILQRSI